MATGGLHREEMERIIKEGGSILHEGVSITNIADLPPGGDQYLSTSPLHPKNRGFVNDPNAEPVLIPKNEQEDKGAKEVSPSAVGTSDVTKTK